MWGNSYKLSTPEVIPLWIVCNEVADISSGVIKLKRTSTTYDPYRRWLAKINTRNNYNTTFQNIKYGFDRVGNILNIENTARNTTQSFQYDDLYQLVKAQGVGDDKGKRNEYLQSFTYDTIGNFTEKTSTTI